MLQHIAIAAGLIVATTFIHAACTGVALGSIHSLAQKHWVLRNRWTRATILAALVFSLSVAGVLEAALWAGAYSYLGTLPNFADALYFSLVTFTTLGYGDITLGKDWRLLAGLQAANGIMMFGWTTALIAAGAQRLFFRHPPQDEEG